MPIITLFSGEFCGRQAVVEDLVAGTGYTHVADKDVVRKVEALTGAPEKKIRRGNSDQFVIASVARQSAVGVPSGRERSP